MKKIIILFILSLTNFSCEAQKNKILDLSNSTEMNYIFSRLSKDKPVFKELYDRGLFITVFKISDTKITPSKYMEDFVNSYIISITPDGDYYSWSKLYKIEKFYNSKILEIKEDKYPIISIKLEYEENAEKKIKTFKFEGIK